mgnify:CR=1 FL=1
MSPDDAHGAADADFRNAVDAEIEVLLQVWEEEMQRPDVDSRYRSVTCQRLSVLLESAPDLLRSVLVAMDEALTEHVAIRVRRIGAPTLEVALACAFDGDEASVVGKALDRSADQAECWLCCGVQKAMNDFNGPAIPPVKEKQETTDETEETE